MDQISIVLDNPSTAYFPGQSITGRVVVRANNEKGTHGIQLKFEGRATVHWTEDRTVAEQGRTERVPKSFADSDSFFDYKSYLLGDGRSVVYLRCGESQYPFTFQLPLNNLPSSYKGQFGKVEYKLEAIYMRPWTFEISTKQCITVNFIVDLNIDPTAGSPGEWRASKTFGFLCCASEPLGMTVRLDKKGYCPGEILRLEVAANNLSSTSVSDLSAELVQEATFYAEGQRKQCSKSVLKAKRGQGVDAGDSDIWRMELRIPSIPPTNLGGCRIITVQYVLKVEAHVSGVSFNLKRSCPIIVGTVPLRRRNEQLRFGSAGDTMPSASYTPNVYPDMSPPHYQDLRQSNSTGTSGWTFSQPPPPRYN